jgi:HEAT repeat protein
MVAAGDGNWAARVPAIRVLKHIGDQRAVPLLVENLHGTNERYRRMAASALSKIGSDREWAIVEAAFADDPAGRGIVEELIESS